MRDRVLQITDKTGNTFKMFVSTPSAGTKIWSLDFTGPGPVNGSWKTVDEGFIRYRLGRTRSRRSSIGDLTTKDLLILGSEGVETHDEVDRFGMQLFEYEDWTGTNDQGEGFVIQPWVLSLTPGRILWEMASPF